MPAFCRNGYNGELPEGIFRRLPFLLGGAVLIGKLWNRKETYDKETLVPVLRVSICTGEQTVGFKEKGSGVFHPIQLIQSEKELKKFMKRYGIDQIDREY